MLKMFMMMMMKPKKHVPETLRAGSIISG